MNQSAEKTLFGKAMDFMSSTFKAEKGSLTKGIEKAAEKRSNKSTERLVDKVIGAVGEDPTGSKFKEGYDAVYNQVNKYTENMGEKTTNKIKNMAQENVAYDAFSSGSTKIGSKEDFAKATASEMRKTNRAGMVEAGKSYFTDPFKTMVDKEASQEARSLAKRQFIGRTGAAAAGVGAVGAIGYNTLTTGGDGQGHGRTFGGAVGNVAGSTVGVGALGGAAAFGASMLKKL